MRAWWDFTVAVARYSSPSDRRRREPFGHQPQDLLLARRQQRAVLARPLAQLREQRALQARLDARLASRDRGDGVEHRLAIRILGEEPGRARRHRLVDQPRVRERRQHQHPRRQPVARDRIRDPDAIDPRHPQVDHRHGRGELADAGQRRAPVADFADQLQPGPFAHRPRDALAEQRMVIRDQHRDARARSSTASSTTTLRGRAAGPGSSDRRTQIPSERTPIARSPRPPRRAMLRPVPHSRTTRGHHAQPRHHPSPTDAGRDPPVPTPLRVARRRRPPPLPAGHRPRAHALGRVPGRRGGRRRSQPRSRSSAGTNPTSPSSTCACPAWTASTSSPPSRATARPSPSSCSPPSTTSRSSWPASKPAPPPTSPRAPTATRSSGSSPRSPAHARPARRARSTAPRPQPRPRPRLDSAAHLTRAQAAPARARRLRQARTGTAAAGSTSRPSAGQLSSALAKLGADDLTEALASHSPGRAASYRLYP